MVNTKINLSMKEPYVRQIYAKQGDTGRVLEIGLEDATLENGTLRILRPDGVEKTSDAVSSDSPTITDGMASFDSLDEAEVTSLKVGISPIQDLHGYANPWVGGAGKNLLENTLTTITNNGVTFTVNSDGSMVLNGTASATAQRQINAGLTLKAGTYILSGMQAGGSTSTRMLYISDGNTIIARDTGAGATFTLSADTTVTVLCWVNNGQAVSNIAIYPMIRLSSISDASWSPYSNICPIYAGNGKNILPNTYERLSHNGVVGTVNADGTVSLSGKATSTAYLRGDYFTLKAGTYTITGCPYGGASSTYRAYLEDVAGSTDNGNRPTFTVASDVSTRYIIQVANGVDSSNLVFKPQVERGSVATAYVPYQGINVYQVGKNLCTRTTTSNIYNASNLIPVKTNDVLYAYGEFTGGYMWGAIFEDALETNKNNRIAVLGNLTSGNVTTYTMTTDGYFGLAFNSSVASYTVDKMMISKTAIIGATDYEPYTETTYPISLGQSVYGGTLDVVGGKLTVDKATLTKTLSEATATATIGTTIKRYGFVLSSGEAVDVAKRDTSISDIAPYGSAFSGEYLHFFFNSAGTELYVFVPIGTDTSTTINVVYPLATPTEVDLTPTQITTLLGTNNMWADGEISELTFDYGKLLSVLTADQTEVVGRCLGDVNFGGASTMPFTLVVKPNNKENA